MGFSTSGAAAILFIGLLVAVGIAYPALETAHERRSTALEDRDQRALEVRNTDVAVNATVYNETTANLTVELRNTGSTTLTVAETDLLIDGVYVETYEYAVAGDATRRIWQPGETVTMTVSLESRPDRVKVVTENGIAETVTGTDVRVVDGGGG